MTFFGRLIIGRNGLLVATCVHKKQVCLMDTHFDEFFVSIDVNNKSQDKRKGDCGGSAQIYMLCSHSMIQKYQDTKTSCVCSSILWFDCKRVTDP